MTEELIAEIARRLDGAKIPYMVVGGQAVLIYGRARMTADIDITVGADSGQVQELLDVCNDLKLDLRTDDPEVFVAETFVLPAEDSNSKMMVDFIFSLSPYEREALERAKEIEVGGYSVRFAACEDVIIQKMVAGRAVDIEDVKSILTKQGDAVDAAYIRKWLGEFEAMPEFGGVVERFDGL